MENEGSINKKFYRMLLAMKNPIMDSMNTHFKSKYASLGQCLAVAKAAASEAGLAISQDVRTEVGTDLTKVSVASILTDGENTIASQWLSGVVPNKDPQYIQALGKVITYLRRYSLVTFLGVVGEEDDDGEGVVRHPTGHTRPTPNVRQETNPVDALVGAGLVRQEAEAAVRVFSKEKLRVIYKNLLKKTMDELNKIREENGGVISPKYLGEEFLS